MVEGATRTGGAGVWGARKGAIASPGGGKMAAALSKR